MSDIFDGTTGSALRSQYKELTFTQINAATNLASAALLITLKSATKLNYLDNGTDAAISVYLGHPSKSAEAGNTHLLFWLEIAPGRVLNFGEFSLPNLEFPAKTTIYVHKSAGYTPTVDKLRIFAWG
jgi:hypothetical protein